MNAPSVRFASLLLLFGAALAAEPPKPNILYILCDDLGAGDVKCFNPSGKIATPQLDALAARGMMFTEAHSSSAVCTPTRYNILPGRYNWRTTLKSGVLGGFSPRLIEEDRLTVAEFLRRQGYHTAAIGKWHLGLEWARGPRTAVSAPAPKKKGKGKASATPTVEDDPGTDIDYEAVWPRADHAGLRRILRHQRLARHAALHVPPKRSRGRAAGSRRRVSDEKREP